MVEQNVRKRCPELEKGVEALSYSFQPCEVGIWNALMEHGGTSGRGLRLFFVAVESRSEEDKEKFGNLLGLFDNSIDTLETSPTAGGLLGHPLKCLPVEVCTPYAVERALSCLEYERRSGTPDHCKQALTNVLSTVEKNLGLKLLPHKFLLSFETLAKAKAPFLGLRCQDASGQGAVVWVEYRDTGTDRSSLLRAGCYNYRMRSSRLELECVSPPYDGHRSVVSFSDLVGPVTLVYSVLEYNLPLGEEYELVLEPWRVSGELAEGFRCLSLAHLLADKALAALGLLYVVWCEELMTYDRVRNLVQLSFLGFCYLGEVVKPACNGGSAPHSDLVMRRNTSCYIEETVLPASVDRKRLKALVRAADIIEDVTSSDDDSAPVLEGGRDLDDRDMRSLWTEAKRGKPVPLKGKMLCDPKDRIVDQAFINMYSKDGVEPAIDKLRLADIHQVLVWYVCRIRAARVDTSRRVAMENLKRVLAHVDEQSRVEAMSVFLRGGEVGAVAAARRARDTTVKQPAAIHRICTMAIKALHPDTRKDAVAQLTDTQWLRSAVWSSEQERKLRGEGIPLHLKKYPIPDQAFWDLADTALKDEAGFTAFQGREVVLKDEEGMGPGVFGSGKWNYGDFVGFYMAVDDPNATGRHLVTAAGQSERGDGAPGWSMPLELFFERGTPGSFMNAASSDRAANVRLERIKAIRYVIGKQKFIFYPLFVRCSFSDQFFRWFYKHSAGRGCNFPDY